MKDLGPKGTDPNRVAVYSELGGGSSGSPTLSEYTALNEPTAPSSGIIPYSRYHTGARKLAFMMPNGGSEVAMQDFIEAPISFSWMQSNNNGGFTLIGMPSGNTVGTSTARYAGASATFIENFKRHAYVTAATANSAASYRGGSGVWLGDGTSNTGMNATFKFGLSQWAAGASVFVGFKQVSGGFSGGIDLKVQTGSLAVVANAGDSNFYFATRGSASLVVDTGIAIDNTSVYAFRVKAGIGTSNLFLSLENFRTGAFFEREINVSTESANIPARNTNFDYIFHTSNNAVLSAQSMDIVLMYLEAVHKL